MRRRFLHSAPERDLPAQHTYFEISDLRRFFDAGVIFATVWVRFIGKTSGGRYNEIRHQRNQGLMMDRIRNNETVEQRRRVLKGALGASTDLNSRMAWLQAGLDGPMYDATVENLTHSWQMLGLISVVCLVAAWLVLQIAFDKKKA